MKRLILSVILVLTAVSGLSALEGLGYYLIPGVSLRQADYSELEPNNFELANFTLDLGLSFRFSISQIVDYEIAGGVAAYFQLENDLEVLHSDLGPGSLFYERGDNYTYYAMLDAIIPFPTEKLRMIAGIKYHITENSFMQYLMGGLFMRTGFELYLTEKQMLKVIFEIMGQIKNPHRAETGEEISELFAVNIQASYVGVFFK